MNYNPTAVQNGLNLAMQRFQTEYGRELYYGALYEIEELITITINDYIIGEDYKDRFITLYSEIIGLAQLVRNQNQEPMLNKEELIAAFAFLASTFNSFKHDYPRSKH